MRIGSQKFILSGVFFWSDRMEIFAYARVSTDEQHEDEGALIKQMRRLRKSGATKIYYDVESRTSDTRKGLVQMIDDIDKSKPGAIAKLLFVRIDRLTSSSITFYQLMGALKKKGIQPYALDEPFDISSIGGELTIDVRLAASKYEVNMLAMRVKKERDTRKANHKPHWNAPLGYVVENDKYKKDDRPCVCLIKDKHEFTRSQLMRFVFDVFLSVGTVSATVRSLHEIFGIQAIAVSKTKSEQVNFLKEDEEIILENINKTRGGGLNLRYPHTGLKWSVSGLRSILVNPVYAGGTLYSTVVRPKGHRKPFDEWDIVWGTHEETIVSREEHERVKSIIRGNRKNRWAAEQKYSNPFAGLLKCACCGAAYTRQCKKLVKRENFIRHHYQCSFYRAGACQNGKMVSSDSLEAQLVNYLVCESDRLASIVQAESQEAVEPPEVKTLRASLSTLESLPSNPAIEKAKEEIIAQIGNAIALQNNNSKRSHFIERRIIQAFSDKLYWESLTREEKKVLLNSCIRKIIIDGKVIASVEFY